MLPTPIAGLMSVQRKLVGDARGFLDRIFCETELAPALKGARIAAVNRTLTAKRGTIRGMHFQYPPHCEDKLVSCLRGEVFDVAVDLRRDSPTFLNWHCEILSAGNHRSLLIPKGFAHGFQALTDDCELLYVHTAGYHAESEGGLDALDPRLGIQWPLPITERSARDMSHRPLDAAFDGMLP
jgi:dTDP-4-dehydrorhamnose 3,5-epimerase